MPTFGKDSLEKLSTVHPDLRAVCEEVIQVYDFTVICGTRTQAEQDKAVAEKKSKVKWPNSKHNRVPSFAVDIAPYPIDWGDLNRFVFLAGHMMQAAHKLGIKIRWGGNWDGNNIIIRDQKFNDLPHFELI
jgi:peptidoglycan L-alanyl-D-glutamate endopeptidase CwlK